jgi:DDE family transposase
MSLSYERILGAIQAVAPSLIPSQLLNLALLINAILLQRTLCLSALARTYPTPPQRRRPQPKHDLLHRVKRLERFLNNERVDAQAWQLAFVPDIVAKLGTPRWLGIAVDWTMFDTILPCGQRVRYQVLRLAVPCRGRALPLLQVAYDRDHLPAHKSQNLLEQEAILALVRVLPAGVQAVILADRGFARAEFLVWLQQQDLAYVVRIDKGTCITETTGRGWKCGAQDPQPGHNAWAPGVRYGLYHGRPRDVVINLATCWRQVGGRRNGRKRKPATQPWYLATSWRSADQAAAWYRQRWWIESSFKDSKSKFGLAAVQVARAERLGRLLLGLTVALACLTLSALPQLKARLNGSAAAITQWGQVSLITIALALFDEHKALPLECLPQAP